MPYVSPLINLNHLDPSVFVKFQRTQSYDLKLYGFEA
jgi:hypothetical protein